MPEEKPEPIDQAELERRLQAGESLEGIEIGDLDFKGREFDYIPNFDWAIFTGKTNFQKAKFLHGVKFYQAKFIAEGGANFFSTQFRGKGGANFSGARFAGRGVTNFTLAEFICDGEVSFSLADFSGEGGTYFSGADFSCKKGVSFTGSKFSGGVDVNYVNTKFGATCRICFDYVKFEAPEKVRFMNVNLANTSFYCSNIEKISFENVKFKEILIFATKRKCLADEFWEERHIPIKDKTPEEIAQGQKDFYAQMEILYCRFKRNFEEQRNYHGAGDFHFGEMEMRRKQQSWWLQILTLTLPYKLISGYGQKWGRALAWFFGLWLGFSGLNLSLVELPKNKMHPTMNGPDISCSQSWNVCNGIKWRDSFFFTLNALTLGKDPNVRVKNLWSARGALALQNLAGVWVIALMLLAIRRQFRR